jgi:putative ABC transport system permease protein
MTIILIIGTTVIFSQLDYIQSRELGYNRDYVIEFAAYHADSDAFRNELLQNPNILSFTSSYPPTGELIGTTGFDWEGKTLEEDIMLYPVSVDYDYLKTFGMKMSEGRFFSREYPSDEAQSVVINETAAKIMGLESPLGKRISYSNPYVQIDGQIIGVINDFHHSSLHNEIEPMVFHFPEEFSHISLKLNPENMTETLGFIETTREKYVRGYPFNYEFFDEQINNFYLNESKIASAFRYFTLLAIFIACLGLFALAAYTAEQRTKEIGIRKVLGAPISTIIFMLSKEFTKWVLAASAVAVPAAYFLSRRWLLGFAYRIDLGWEIFAVSIFAALAIAVLTVSYQAIKTATANPVDSLRHE